MKKLRWISLTFLSIAATLAAPSCARVFPDKETPETRSPLACYHQLSLSVSGVSPLLYGPADVLVYDADGMQLLDSYCRTALSSSMQIASRGGEKNIVVISGAEISALPFNCFDSMESFSLQQYSLADEDPSRPVIAASGRIRAGGPGRVGMTLTPMLCKIRLLPVKIDLSGRPYASNSLTGIKAYLINVASRAFFYDANDSSDTEIINCARYDGKASSSLKYPSMLYQESAAGGATLYCYPRSAAMCEHSSARPTKLVVEARLDGVTYYYPVEIGDGDMHRGMSYTYEMRITRAGSCDPDESARPESFTLRVIATPWEEYDDEYESY